MLVPAMDLMDGKIVQLVQGEEKALEFSDPEPWIERFSQFPLVHLIDLDAAKGKPSNRAMVEQLVKRLPCQVGGGIRNAEDARALLDAGARSVILGSALVRDGIVNLLLAQDLAAAVTPERLIFAVDAKQGKVTTNAWRGATNLTPESMMRELESCCGAFLYTHVDGEGLMQGLPLDIAKRLRAATSRRLFVAGGIASLAEIDALHKLGADAVVGMALYSGRLNQLSF
jgi:phosphoribosylformimino-5-aminoimidazole carboxamide ribotide isomerase